MRKNRYTKSNIISLTMKHLLILLALFSINANAGDKIYTDANIEIIHKTILLDKETQQPITGLYKEFKRGAVDSISSFKNGIRDGVTTSYSKYPGKKEYELIFKNGVIHGSIVAYSYSTGAVNYSMEVLNGVVTKATKYKKDGAIMEVGLKKAQKEIDRMANKYR